MGSLGLIKKLQEKRVNLIILGLVALVSCFFSPSVLSLFLRWLKLSQDLSHGLPTLAIFIFFIWRISPLKHDRNSRSAYWLMYAALAVLSFAWYLFQSINIELPSALLLILLLIVYLAACFSIGTAVDLLPFLSLLLFVVPILSELNDQLVRLSSFVVGTWVNTIELTAVIEGNNILIPSGRILIADGCSGLRYLSITVLLAYIICLLNGYNLRQSMLTLLCATCLGLLTNWIRIFLLVLIGYHSDMQSRLMHDHEIFGWILFILIIMPAIYWAPIIRRNIDFMVKVSACKPLIPTLFLALGPVLFFSTLHSELSSNKLNLNGLAVTEATMTEAAITEVIGKSAVWIPIDFSFSTEKVTRFCSVDGIIARLDLAKFTPSSSSEKLVPYIQSVLPKDDWMATDQKANISFDHFESTILKNINSSQKILLLHQFNVGNSATGSYRLAKLLQLKAKFSGQNFFGLLTIQANCKTDCINEMGALKKITENWQLNKFNNTQKISHE